MDSKEVGKTYVANTLILFNSYKLTYTFFIGSTLTRFAKEPRLGEFQ